VCHHLHRRGKRICSKRPKTQGKIEISHSVKDRPKQAAVGSHLGDWVDDTLIGVGPVCLFVLTDRASRLLVARRWHHDSADVLKAELGLLLGRPLEMLTPEWGKQFARHTGLTKAL
jgi:IS30 family transposase